MKKGKYTDLIKTVVIIAMIVNVLMFVVNAMQVKAAHVDLDADQMHYSIRLCVKNVVSLIELGLIMCITMYYHIQL